MSLANLKMLIGIVTVLTGACSIPPDAHALTETGSVGDLRFAVYAPDWTWQKRDINVLVVLENTGRRPADVTLNLVFPPGKESHFRYETDPRVELIVPGRRTIRYAFTDIRALDGVPRQTYAFAIELGLDDRQVRVPYPVRTIRGAMVSPGKWALFAPGAVALAWCIVFAVVVGRMAPRSAWREPGAPTSAPEKTERWINVDPTQ